MGILEVLLIGVGLSMDAFAVAIGKGICMPKFRAKDAGLIALFFGGFQALMPLIGWLLGKSFEHAITAVDHWIAFGLLLFIGGKMLWEAFHHDANEEAADQGVSIRELLLLSIATSIDALAVGITFAFLSVSIGPAIGLIGVTTFVISFAGVALGRTLGGALCKKAEIAGGIVLIGIGLKILLEHLGVF